MRSRPRVLTARLQTLASLVPSLQSVDPNRLSKHVVVDESITFIKAEQQTAAHSLRTVDALLAEREGLLAELNRWRASAGLDVRLPQDLPADVPTQSPVIRQGSMHPVGADPRVDWVGGHHDLLPAGDEPALMEEPEPFGAPELELDNSLDLMQLPVGSGSSAGPMGGASWSPSATDFAMPGLQTDFGDLFSTKSLPQQTIAQTYGLPLTDMELAQEGPVIGLATWTLPIRSPLAATTHTSTAAQYEGLISSTRTKSQRIAMPYHSQDLVLSTATSNPPRLSRIYRAARAFSTLSLLRFSPPVNSSNAIARRSLDMGSASIALVSSAPPLAR